MFLLLKYTLLYTVVLMMVALGGMFSERSGIINIALEGIMVIVVLMGVCLRHRPSAVRRSTCWLPRWRWSSPRV